MFKPVVSLCCAAIALGLSTTQSFGVDVLPPPKVGDKVEDFKLASLRGGEVSLKETLKAGPVVLVVLRGFPGYQCPICSRQVGGLIGNQKEFAGTNVILVYPGPAEGLREKAKEFAGGKTLPENFHMLLDPDYKFTNAYNLRWDARRETSYPSTFVINEDGEITYATVSKTHGGRPKTGDVVAAVKALN